MCEAELVPGMRVRFTDGHLHNMDPRYYPPTGTVGEVQFRWAGLGSYFVRWPAGTTMDPGLWCARRAALEVVDDG